MRVARRSKRLRMVPGGLDLAWSRFGVRKEKCRSASMEVAMSATGVTALDHTVQETNVWLKAVQEELGLDNRQQAYSALRAALHSLRDRLPPEVAIKLAAQLPILVRGIYYENWGGAGPSTKERHVEAFAQHVWSELPQQFPANPLT